MEIYNVRLNKDMTFRVMNFGDLSNLFLYDKSTARTQYNE